MVTKTTHNDEMGESTNYDVKVENIIATGSFYEEAIYLLNSHPPGICSQTF